MTRTSARRLAGIAPALALTLAFLSGPVLAQGNPASPVGLWKTVDDDTKQAKALIRVSERDGLISGRIEKVLTDKADARCELCTDERKDKPVQGMTIITGMKRDGEHWSGGQILDPNNGKVYRSQMKLIDGGKRLEVRGYIGTPLLGRTQTWHREE
ncbi:MAG TPA: DUF2147 domain-containing protein [Burkholderiaceae bacterium]|jgi:uncharacterized protein (DUF2147 family)|nr:DUF2147 domain-containing protein [Burkholderiaceae bacterium]